MSDIGFYRVSPNSLYMGMGKGMIVMVRREKTVTAAT